MTGGWRACFEEEQLASFDEHHITRSNAEKLPLDLFTF